jgi:DNA repair exonuclease SbcCD nuclease subunit
MSKFVILGDMHIGARGASTIVMEHQLKYFADVLFPYMKMHNITTILQLGDMFDTRKFSNHVILYHWKKRFFNYLETNNINFVTLLGNHDVAFKDTIVVNSTTLFLEQYENILIVDQPLEWEYEDIKFLLLPWICDGNREHIKMAIEHTTAIYCAGHFEFAGFEMHKGHMMETGADPKEYEKFDTVFSGHYHTKSKKDNIQYVGTPYELTWIDWQDPKGFFVFDTKKQKTQYVRSDKQLFVKLQYDDKGVDSDYHKSFDVSTIKDSYVKLIVVNKTDTFLFEKVLDKILTQTPIELKIVDEVENFEDVDIDDVDIEDTTTLIESFIGQIETDLDKDKLISGMKSLYVEAISLI